MGPREPRVKGRLSDGVGGNSIKKTSLNVPIWISNPLVSNEVSTTRRRLRKVPLMFLAYKSTRWKDGLSRWISAWNLETVIETISLGGVATDRHHVVVVVEICAWVRC